MELVQSFMFNLMYCAIYMLFLSERYISGGWVYMFQMAVCMGIKKSFRCLCQGSLLLQ